MPFSPECNYKAKLNGATVTITRLATRKVWEVANSKEVLLVASDRREVEEKLGLLENVSIV